MWRNEGRKEGRVRPPPLIGFDGFGASGRMEEGEREREGEYFECEQSDIMHDELIDTFQRPKVQELAVPLRNTQSKASLRIEDQAIIVVEEESDLASNNGGGESIILEHIEFRNQTIENTPKWPQQNHQQHRDQQPWLRVDEENYSDSQQDFSSGEFRVHGVRLSKNTCVDRLEPIYFEGNNEKNNKSCIAKPMSSADDLEEGQGQGEEMEDEYGVRHIIGNYSALHRQAYAQTDLSGKELLQNEQYLSEELTFLQGKVKGMQEEILRWKQKEAEQVNQIGVMQECLAAHDRNIEELKEVRERCGEMERTISMQRKAIKEYEQNSQQQIKQSKMSNTNFLSFSQKTKHSDSLRSPLALDASHTECRREIEDLQEHIFDIEQKMARVEMEIELKVEIAKRELQEQISAKYGQEYGEMIDSLKKELKGVREDSHKLLAEWSMKELELKNREIQVKRVYEELVKQRHSIEEQQQRRARKSYDLGNNYNSPKLVTRQRQNTQQSFKESERSDHPLRFSSRQIKSDFKPSRSPIRNNSDFPHAQTYRYSLTTKPLPTPHPHAPPRAYPPEPPLRDFSKPSPTGNHELFVISSKIQRLRSEITRELDSIH